MDAQLLVKVSKLYYEEGMTQAAIANRLRISRPKVSRLLSEARDKGIVQITVNSQEGGFEDLERELEAATGLTDSVIVDVPQADNPASVSLSLGRVAAQYFDRVIQDCDIIGFSWGNTLSVMADAIQPLKMKNIQIVQMVGGLGDPLADTHAADIARRVAQKLNAKLAVMPAPGIVDEQDMCQALKQDRHINYAIDLGEKVNIAFVGIGSFRPDALLMRNEEIISWQEVDPLVARGAVGDLGLHFFDRDGNPMNSDVDKRIIGVDLAVYRQLDRVVAVAGGSQKFDAILGAIRGGFAKVLITDEQTAQRLIQEFDS
jgi:DNA-binding transcriptional regulator LsrR (DeoR family)